MNVGHRHREIVKLRHKSGNEVKQRAIRLGLTQSALHQFSRKQSDGSAHRMAHHPMQRHHCPWLAQCQQFAAGTPRGYTFYLIERRKDCPLPSRGRHSKSHTPALTAISRQNGRAVSVRSEPQREKLYLFGQFSINLQQISRKICTIQKNAVYLHSHLRPSAHQTAHSSIG